MLDKYNELILFYKTDDNIKESFNITEINDETISSCFNKYAENNSVEISIEELMTNYNNNLLFIETPDGYQKITKLFKKDKILNYQIETHNHSVMCSSNHLLQSSDNCFNWIFAKKLNVNDFILTKSGIEQVTRKIEIGEEYVYDFEVDHFNKRYWSGGISSHNSGKSFLAMNVCREAQATGCYIIYIDTEWAVDRDIMKKFGIDTSDDKVAYHPINTVEEVNEVILTTAMTLLENKKNGLKIPKIVVVIDSLGNLSTRREIEGVVTQDEKADMGNKQKLLKKLFATCTLNSGMAGMTIIAIQHTISNIGGYGESKVIAGGVGQWFNSSTVLQLSKAKLADGSDKKTETGIIALSRVKKSRFTKKGIPVSFHISDFTGMNPYVGLEQFISWENCGIQAGKISTDKADKGEFIESGKKILSFAVQHLGKSVKPSQLFTPQVFTQEVLEKLAPILRKAFVLPDPSSEALDSVMGIIDYEDGDEIDGEDDDE